MTLRGSHTLRVDALAAVVYAVVVFLVMVAAHRSGYLSGRHDCTRAGSRCTVEATTTGTCSARCEP